MTAEEDPFAFPEDPDALPEYVTRFSGIADRNFQNGLVRFLQDKGLSEDTIARSWPFVSYTLDYIRQRKEKARK